VRRCLCGLASGLAALKTTTGALAAPGGARRVAPPRASCFRSPRGVLHAGASAPSAARHLPAPPRRADVRPPCAPQARRLVHGGPRRAPGGAVGVSSFPYGVRRRARALGSPAAGPRPRPVVLEIALTRRACSRAAEGTFCAVSWGAHAPQRAPRGAAGRPCRYAPPPLARKRAHPRGHETRLCCSALRSGWAGRVPGRPRSLFHHLGRGRSAPERARRPHRVAMLGPRAPGVRGDPGSPRKGQGAAALS